MDITRVVGSYKELLVTENENVSDKILVDHSIEVTRPDFSLMVEFICKQRKEQYLVLGYYMFAVPPSCLTWVIIS